MFTTFCLTSQNRFGRMSKTSFYISVNYALDVCSYEPKYYSANNIPGAKKGLAIPLSLSLLNTEPFFG